MTTLKDLKDLPQWVGWTGKPLPNGKPDKCPMNPHNGKKGDSTRPDTWTAAAEAWQAKKRFKWAGIGFVFTIPSGIVGVDLDHCFEVDAWGVKHLKTWARDVVQCLNSYTEKSPSGDGLHILCRGEIPYSINKSNRGFEMYNELRYFTVTGDLFGGVNAIHEIRERTTELNALHAVFADEVLQVEDEMAELVDEAGAGVSSQSGGESGEGVAAGVGGDVGAELSGNGAV